MVITVISKLFVVPYQFMSSVSFVGTIPNNILILLRRNMKSIELLIYKKHATQLRENKVQTHGDRVESTNRIVHLAITLSTSCFANSES